MTGINPLLCLTCLFLYPSQKYVTGDLLKNRDNISAKVSATCEATLDVAVREIFELLEAGE
jgi:hypothetical protein